MRNLFLAAVAVVVLAGCVVNQVALVQSADSVIKFQQGGLERFANMHPRTNEYPLTCEDDCYPASDLVQCETPGENCTFVGEQLAPALNTGYTVRWLGHSSFYLQTPDGHNLLIDPVSGQFDWPVNWAFRMTENGFYRKLPVWPSEQEIANVDAVLYSHLHYDHFNKDDLKAIGTGPEYFTPLRFAEHFPYGGYQVSEVAWFAGKTLDDLEISAVPANHFSSRIQVPYLVDDEDRTLWNAWVLEHEGKRLFYAGDTGYSPHFKDIHERFGDMDICLMPIASYYHPQYGKWYRYVHLAPEDALVAADELGCKVMIPFGYGNATWKMGDHSSHSALLRLLKMHQQMHSDVPLLIFNEGDEIPL